MNSKLIQICFIQTVLLLVTGENICSSCRRGILNCRRISGIYTLKSLSPGYHPLVDIPAGACNINITELQPSKNYLALKSGDGHWFLNGRWHLSTPGTYYGVGSSFRYDRESVYCKSECIWSQGPTDQKLKVQLLYSTTNNGVLYEFTLPPNVQSRDSQQPGNTEVSIHRRRHRHRLSNRRSHHSRNNHHRYTSGRTRYSTNNNNLHTDRGYTSGNRRYRGSSTRRRGENVDNINRAQTAEQVTRNVYDSDLGSGTNSRRHGHDIPYVISSNTNQNSRTAESSDRYHELTRAKEEVYNLPTGNTEDITLEGETRPHSRVDQVVLPSIDSQYSWRIAGFTECSHPCGTGVQTTRIVCILKHNQVTVTEDNCDITKRPYAQNVTCNTSPCQPQWIVFPWSPCSTTCGDGTQTRRVECKQRISQNISLSVSASLCDNSQKPVIIQQCFNESPCTRWNTGTWGQCSVNCGKGEQVRMVNCLDANNRTVAERMCPDVKPKTSRGCDMGLCDYLWFHSAWTNGCSTNCGSGYKTRSIVCSTLDGEMVNNSSCDLNEKPEDKKSCRQSENCHSSWFVGQWGQCSATCGRGVRSRPVVCVHRDGSSLDTSRVVEDDQCRGTPKPAEEESCEVTGCEEGAIWHMSEWSKCSVTCGDGYATRSVLCMDQSYRPHSGCDQADRPATRKTCTRESCVQAISDPKCKNRYKNCPIVVQARLCRYGYYKKLCCAACSNDGKDGG